jgi:hypothetical protein
VQNERDTGDRCGRHHDQLEEPRHGGDRGTGDHVPNGAHQREARQQHDQPGSDGDRGIELQPEFRAEDVQRHRGCGCDCTADRVLEEER